MHKGGKQFLNPFGCIFSQALCFFIPNPIIDLFQMPSSWLIQHSWKNKNKTPLCAILQASPIPRTSGVHLVLPFQGPGLFALRACINKHNNCLYFFDYFIYLPSPFLLGLLSSSPSWRDFPALPACPSKLTRFMLAGFRGPIIMCNGQVNPPAPRFWTLAHHD